MTISCFTLPPENGEVLTSLIAFQRQAWGGQSRALVDRSEESENTREILAEPHRGRVVFDRCSGLLPVKPQQLQAVLVHQVEHVLLTLEPRHL